MLLPSHLTAVFAALGLLVTSARSTTITYDGPTGGDWNSVANWSSDTLPTLADNVVIPAGKQVRVSSAISSNHALAHSLTLQVTGQILIVDNMLQIATGTSDASGFTGLDLAALLGQWTGPVPYSHCPPYTPQDLNQDCKVNGLDLALLLGAWE